jgi:hypothetical protein
VAREERDRKRLLRRSNCGPTKPRVTTASVVTVKLFIFWDRQAKFAAMIERQFYDFCLVLIFVFTMNIQACGAEPN